MLRPKLVFDLGQKDAAVENAMAIEADKGKPDLVELVKHGTDNLRTNTTTLHGKNERQGSSETTAGTQMVGRLFGVTLLTEGRDGSTATHFEEDLDVSLEGDGW